MPSLRDIQQHFVAALLHDRPDLAGIIADGRFAATRHLQVYRNNVFESLTAALRAVYPAIARLVGDGFFRYTAHEYVVQYPPTGGNLHDFGGRFAEFLFGFPAAAGHEYLPDVARLEWAWHEAFHAAEAAPLDPSSLAEVPPAQYAALRFILHPSARLVTSRFPLAALWEANILADGEVPELDLKSGADELLVIRRGLTVAVERLAQGEYALLETIARQQPFGDACEAALARDPQFDLGRCLQKHVRCATLTGFLH